MEQSILFLPLIGAMISGFFGNKIGDRTSEIITCVLTTTAAFLSIIIFYKVISEGYENNIILFKWIYSGTLDVNWSIKIDALSSVMLVVVTFCVVISSHLLYWLYVS